MEFDEMSKKKIKGRVLIKACFVKCKEGKCTFWHGKSNTRDSKLPFNLAQAFFVHT